MVKLTCGSSCKQTHVYKQQQHVHNTRANTPTYIKFIICISNCGFVLAIINYFN